MDKSNTTSEEALQFVTNALTGLVSGVVTMAHVMPVAPLRVIGFVIENLLGYGCALPMALDASEEVRLVRRQMTRAKAAWDRAGGES